MSDKDKDQPQVGDKEPDPEKEKRLVKPTEKGLELIIENCQKIRGSCVKKAGKSKETLIELMKDNDNENAVKRHLIVLIDLCGEARECHSQLIALQLPELETERQNKWFLPKIDILENFIKDVHVWLSEVKLTKITVESEPLMGHTTEHVTEIEPQVKVTVEMEPETHVEMEPEIHVETVSEMEKQMHVTETEIPSAVNYDDIRPHDSISNITRNRTTVSKSSSTSSARIRALAEKAALMEQVAALQKKHDMEKEQEQLDMQKEKIRRKQEKLEMETKLAAANARAHVFESMGSRGSSRVSEKGAAAPKKVSLITNTYSPHQIQQGEVSMETEPPSQPQAVRPKRSMYEKSAKAHYMTPLMQYSPSMQSENVMDANVEPERVQNAKVQTESVHVVNDVRDVDDVQGHGHVGETTPPAGYISNVLQRQNDITNLLVKQNLYSTLPPRDIPIYEGDPLQYDMFIRAFEGGVERKTDNFSDCLHFLQQYTKGHPNNLVRSCQHLPPSQGYQKAKQLLKEHFGNEHKIATAYMDKAFAWASMKPEDVKGLQEFSLFLRGCCNAMENLEYMEEMNVISNMRTILMKLPYRLREGWRKSACDLQEHGRRAKFADLVNFIEKQVKILSNPLFGNIHDTKQTTSGRTSAISKPRDIKSSPRSTFATTVMPLEKAANGMTEVEKVATSSTENCLFCNKSGHLLGWCPQIRKTTHREKIDFLKRKGVCFGCLKRGHLSKDCRSRLTCEKCKQKHPDLLHYDQTEQTPQKTLENNAVVSPHSCMHIGAGDETSIFSIVPVQVKSQKGETVLQTYAFWTMEAHPHSAQKA